jgi:hypothetical protein
MACNSSLVDNNGDVGDNVSDDYRLVSSVCRYSVTKKRAHIKGAEQ